MGKKVRCFRLSEETVRLISDTYHEMKKVYPKLTEDDVLRLALKILRNEKIDLIKLELQSAS